MFHTVFCRSAVVPAGQDVANWVLDAAAFDDDPDFLPPFEALEGAFGALEVIYAKRKRPVQIERIDGQRLAEDVEEAVTLIVDACEPETAAEVSARLRASVQAYQIEFDEMLASEEAWELVYDLDARIAQELDGIIFVRDEAVYGAEGNQMICDLT